ncbi:MAG: hypothetical protein JXA30_07320 [Deltaproteobacteria bacterium]|nr:hypothetical protein [Deltaproteobacteria bacterium]
MRQASTIWRSSVAWLVGFSTLVSFSGGCGDEQRGAAQGSDAAGVAAAAATAQEPAGTAGQPGASTSGAPHVGTSGVSAGGDLAGAQSSAGASASGAQSEVGQSGGAGGNASPIDAAHAGTGAEGGFGGVAGSTDGGREGATPDSTDGGRADATPDSTRVTAVCVGGTVGMDSDSFRADALTVRREYAAVKYHGDPSIPILNFKTTMLVPKTPSSRQTLFIWPGLQCKEGASDPAGIGNGVLQPVLTWGSSCAPQRPRDTFGGWWMAGMYVNVTTGAAGPTGCAGGDYMMTEVGDLLEIDMSVEGSAWTQTITDLRTMEIVDFTIDLKNQVQNAAMWVVEVPDGTSIRPVEDTVFTDSVLTFEKPVSSCQPTQAGANDYFSAPVRSSDGLHCCYDKIILRAQRTDR